MRALDWIGRTLLLILSGFATLSLIGAIAQVADIVPDAPVSMLDRSADPVPTPDGQVVVASEPSAQVAVAAPPPAEDAVARWLEALVYAVLALAGFAAAGVVVLLRLTATLNRIANR